MGMDFDALRAQFGLDKVEKKEKKQDYSQFEGKDNTRNSGRKGNNGGGRYNGGGRPSSNNNVDVLVTDMSATAPYNFVRFPSAVLESPIEEIYQSMDKQDYTKAYKEYINSIDTLSGYIDLDIELKTPLFIRAEEGETIAPINPDKPIIPGSSMRGMIKNLYKIITCGSLRADEDYTERHLYYRCIMAVNSVPWTKPLHSAYDARMSGARNGKLVKNAKPGFILKIGKKYYIAPTLSVAVKREFIKTYITKYKTKISPLKSSRIDWQGSRAYIITGSQKDFRLKTEDEYKRMKSFEKLKAGKQQIRYIDLHDIDKSQEHWLEIPDSVIYEYENDTKRGGVNLLKYEAKSEAGNHIQQGPLKGDLLNKMVPDLVKKGVEYLIPCFFLNDGDKVTAFGHGQCFRIPYLHSIGDRIPAPLRTNTIDYSDAIFGRKELWGSRVFFEDAVAEDKVGRLESKKVVLGEPNPTSYQLYLQQKSNTPLVHWDMEGAKLKGYKMYWHQQGDWNKVESAPQAQDKVSTDIKPIPKGTKFKGKIRFKNLSKAELGAILMVFDMDGTNKKIAYKLGQGKSLGLGSVSINAKLMLDKKENYTGLFGNDGWLNASSEEKFTEYIGEFKSALADNQLENSWQGVMKDLTTVLAYDNITNKKDWSKRVAVMQGTLDTDGSYTPNDKFKERAALKTVDGVVK